MRCLSKFSGCGWAHGFTLTLLPPQMFPRNCESWLKFYLMQVCKPCHFALVEAVEPFKLHPISMSYVYEVFEHLLRLWMGIWLHTHTITTILWINLLKRKNCVRVVLHSYLELSWSYGKTLWGLHRTLIFHAPTKAFLVEINTFCILPAKVCCETWSKVGDLHVICVLLLWDWANISWSTYHTLKNKNPCKIYDTLHRASKKKSSTTVRHRNCIYLFSK